MPIFSLNKNQINAAHEKTEEALRQADELKKAAQEIKNFPDSIITSSEIESGKAANSGATVKSVFENIGKIINKINSNYTFTQKIDVSIKQQEHGSIQAAETMKQMSEFSRQSAEIARQTLNTVKSIVEISTELEQTMAKYGIENRTEE